MELADKMSFPSMAVTVDVNVVFFSSIAIKKKKKSKVRRELHTIVAYKHSVRLFTELR